MDYSSIHEDTENAAITSPWATSPQLPKSTFDETATNDRPPSPTPALPQASYLSNGAGARQDSSLNRSTNGQGANGYSGRNETADLPYRSQQNAPQADYGHREQQPQSRTPGLARPQQQQRQPSNRSTQGIPRYKLQAKLTGLERQGRKDPILRFDIYTNLPGFRTTQFRDVRRTHNEFSKLAEHLISANPEALVPAVPLSQTSAGVGTDEDENRVKANMQRWLNYVCGNEVLMRDEEMVRFVEGDPGYSPVIKRSQPATGVRRKVIKQFAPPPDDTPELQEARPIVKRFYLATMDAGQKVEKVVKARRGLGLAESDVGVKLSALTEQEMHPGLKNAYRKLGKTIQTAGDLASAQGTAEATTLGDPLAYHSADAFIVKETLTNRHILLRELLQAQTVTRSRLSATDRLKSSTSVRRDKVDEAIAALDEARNHEAYLGHKAHRVTANLVDERRAWFARTAADLRASIREYAVREIEAERRALATLEAIRPDIRAVDASGGLSRLGREPAPPGRRTTMVSSQGPKGDAWSGVQRRPDGLNRSISGSFVGVVPGSQDVGPGGAGGGGGGAGFGDDDGAGRQRAASGAGSLKGVAEDDEDRVDARNAASRLASSTF